MGMVREKGVCVSVWVCVHLEGYTEYAGVILHHQRSALLLTASSAFAKL